jgi:arylsulfatase A-like enzyme
MSGRRPWDALVRALLVSACLACADPTLSGTPDVLLVVLDTVRADRLSAYGHERPTSPELEALARRGVLFEDVTAPSNWTWPTHASLFTGVPPWEHGAHFGRGEGEAHFDWGGFAKPMRRDLPTLAERFAAAGYRTVFLAANPVLKSPIADSLTRGFELRHQVGADRLVLERARAELEGADRRPLFLFVNLMGAHNPYRARPVPWLRDHRDRLDPLAAPDWLRPFLARRGGAVDLQASLHPGGRTLSLLIADGELPLHPSFVELLRDLYDGELVELDGVLGELVSAWRRFSGDSIVAVTSDHGEYLGEHGLVEHTYLLYSEVVRVPLVLSAPGRLPENVRIATPVELQDVYASLLDLALGQERDASLRSLASGAATPPRAPVRAIAYPRTDTEVEALRYVYRYYREGDEVLVARSDGARELYDLGADPGMNEDLAHSRGERAAELAARAATAFQEVRGVPGPPVVIPPEAREQLRKLGYTDQ